MWVLKHEYDFVPAKMEEKGAIFQMKAQTMMNLPCLKNSCLVGKSIDRK